MTRFYLGRFYLASALVTVCLSQLHAQTNDFKISYEPSQPTLPTSIQIQSAAHIGDTILAVWGSARMQGDSVVNELCYQVLVDTIRIGKPQVFTSGFARPAGFVKVTSVRDLFVVVWNDSRGNGSSFMRRITTRGFFIGGEIKLPTVVRPGIVTAKEVRGGYVVMWNTLTSADTGLFAAGFDDVNTMVPDFHKLSASLAQSTVAFAGVQDSVLLCFSGGRMNWLDNTSGSLSPVDSTFAEHFKVPSAFGSDGSLVELTNDSTLNYYSSCTDTRISSTSHVSLPPGLTKSNIILTHNDSGDVLIVYSSGGGMSLDYRNNVGMGVYMASRTLTMEGIIGAVVSYGDHYSVPFYQAFTNFCGNGWTAYHGLIGITRSSPFASVATFQGEYKLDCYHSGMSWTNHMWPIMGIEVSDDFIANSWNDSVSVSRLGQSMHVHSPSGIIAIDEPIHYEIKLVPQALPALSPANGRVLCTWTSPSGNDLPIIWLGEFANSSGQSSTQIDSLTTWEVVSDTNHTFKYFDSLDQSYSVNGRTIVSSRHGWTAPPPPGTKVLSNYVLNVNVPCDTGFIPVLSLSALRRDSVVANMFLGPVYNYDPNTGMYVGAVGRAAEGSAGFYLCVFAFDTLGRVLYKIDSVAKISSLTGIIPIRDSEYVIMYKGHGVRYVGRDTVAEFNVVSSPIADKYVRLLGDRMMVSASTSQPWTYISYTNLFGGRLKPSIEINALVNASGIVQNPRDSSIAIAYCKTDGVYLATFDKNMRPIQSPTRIVSTVAKTNISALFHNDSLFLAWEDYRNGSTGDIYGTALRVSTVADVRESGTRASAPNAIANIRPNPAGASAEVVFAAPARDGDQVDLVDINGSIVAHVDANAGLRACAFQTRDLPSGVYTVVYRGRNTVHSSHLSIVR